MSKIFYLSSWGGSATAWLARSLDLHPNVTCFHGGRFWPQIPASQEHEPQSNPGSTERTPAQFAEDLASLGGDDHFAGAVHGYHGLSMQQAANARQGRFGMIARDPIMRVTSLTTHHLDKAAHTASGTECMALVEFFFHYAKRYKSIVDRFMEAKFIAPLNGTGDIKAFIDDMTFLWVALETMANDIHMLTLEKDHIFRMEDFTRDPGTFGQLFSTMTQGALPCDDGYLESVFSQGKINAHRRKKAPKDPRSTFLTWPDNHQMMFLFCLKIMPKMAEVAERFDYPILNELQQAA
ncbi:MAG: hypothetical protein HQL52_05170 [Magnetococcales bacterium]|nr:hypothetical protein [Magnetococcales bacterium]